MPRRGQASAEAAGVDASFERAPARRFDLVIGADGLHSQVRRVVFGPERQFASTRGCATPPLAGSYANVGELVLRQSGPGRRRGIERVVTRRRAPPWRCSAPTRWPRRWPSTPATTPRRSASTRRGTGNWSTHPREAWRWRLRCWCRARALSLRFATRSCGSRRSWSRHGVCEAVPPRSRARRGSFSRSPDASKDRRHVPRRLRPRTLETDCLLDEEHGGAARVWFGVDDEELVDRAGAAVHRLCSLALERQRVVLDAPHRSR